MEDGFERVLRRRRPTWWSSIRAACVNEQQSCMSRVSRICGQAPRALVRADYSRDRLCRQQEGDRLLNVHLISTSCGHARLQRLWPGLLDEAGRPDRLASPRIRTTMCPFRWVWRDTRTPVRPG